MKILIVDDSKTIRMMIGKLLKTLGHEPLDAANGKEALDILRADRAIGMALVDWNMPVMGGMDLVKAVRADEGLRGTRLIMVSTETEMDRVREAIKEGADEYIMKPFSKEAIEEKIQIVETASKKGD